MIARYRRYGSEVSSQPLSAESAVAVVEVVDSGRRHPQGSHLEKFGHIVLFPPLENVALCSAASKSPFFTVVLSNSSTYPLVR